jgi:hypothetical protein
MSQSLTVVLPKTVIFVLRAWPTRGSDCSTWRSTRCGIALVLLAGSACGGRIEPRVDDAGVCPAVDAALVFGPSTSPTGCEPWSKAMTDGFVVAPTTVELATQSIVGCWIGWATPPSPWLEEPWLVSIRFNSDGSYLAQGYEGPTVPLYSAPNPLPFYYGDVEKCPSLDRWRLLNSDAQGVSGQIDIPFYSGVHSGNGPCYLPVWQGELSALVFDASRNHLRFSFAADALPIPYDLWRMCAAP